MPYLNPSPPGSPPPAPVELVITPPVLDLGEVARVGTVSLTNVGTEPVTYSLSTSDSWVLPPPGGTLDAGASVTLSVLVDRTAVPAGPSTLRRAQPTMFCPRSTIHAPLGNGRTDRAGTSVTYRLNQTVLQEALMALFDAFGFDPTEPVR